MTWAEDLWCVIASNVHPNEKFTLGWAYAQASSLQELHPENHAVTEKIRQTLRSLVEKGLVEKLSPGVYRRRTVDEAAASWVERRPTA